MCVCEREKDRERGRERRGEGDRWREDSLWLIIYFSKWYLGHSGPLCYKSLTEGRKVE